MANPQGFDYFLRGRPLFTAGGKVATTGLDYFLRLRVFPTIQTTGGTTLAGNTATATALANASTPSIDIQGSLATATAEAFFGTQEVGVAIQGSLATASGLANAGSLQIHTYADHDRRFFRLRTEPTRM